MAGTLLEEFDSFSPIVLGHSKGKSITAWREEISIWISVKNWVLCGLERNRILAKHTRMLHFLRLFWLIFHRIVYTQISTIIDFIYGVDVIEYRLLRR